MDSGTLARTLGGSRVGFFVDDQGKHRGLELRDGCEHLEGGCVE